VRALILSLLPVQDKSKRLIDATLGCLRRYQSTLFLDAKEVEEVVTGPFRLCFLNTHNTSLAHFCHLDSITSLRFDMRLFSTSALTHRLSFALLSTQSLLFITGAQATLNPQKFFSSMPESSESYVGGDLTAQTSQRIQDAFDVSSE
jgi:hypothetical protein